jgi:ankyrin repeat protein
MTTNKGDRQDEAPPATPSPKEIEAREINQTKPSKALADKSSKDGWDIAQIIISGVSGVFLVFLGIVFTIHYNNRQSDLIEIQIVNGFIEHLASPDPSKQELALLGLASLDNQDLVIHLSSHPSLSSALNNSFLRVVCDGDGLLVKRFLKAGVRPVNVGDQSRKSALMWAADKGYASIVESIVENAYSVPKGWQSEVPSLLGAKDVFKQTAVHWALRSQHPEIAEYLIRKGSRDSADDHGETALMIAAQEGYEKAVDLLLQVHDNPNYVPSEESYTPLMSAAHNDHLAIVKSLINHGANINATTKYGHSSLSLACYKGNTALAKYLIQKGAAKNAQDTLGRTPLMGASIAGRQEIAQLLIIDGADLNIQDKAGWTAMMHAKRHGNEEITRLLIAHGATSLGVDKANLVYAAATNNAQSLKELIRRGIDLNVRDDREMTPLMIASQENNIDAINILLKAKADISSKTSTGATAMHFALSNQKKEAAELLLKSGAPIFAKNDTGDDAFLLASRNGYLDIVKQALLNKPQLEYKNAAGKTALFLSVEHAHAIIVEELLHAGANPNCVDNFGNTPLMVVGFQDYDRDSQINARIAQALIKAHADIEAKNKYGMPVVFLSLSGFSKGIFPVLLQHGVNVKSKDPMGRTLLMYVAQQGYLETCKDMVSSGVDVEAKDKYGLRAMDYAKMAGLKEVLEYLSTISNDGLGGLQ